MRCSIFLLFMPLLAFAQTNDRQRPESEPIAKADALRQRVADARWRRGSFYVTPVIGIDNAGYDENVFSTESGEQGDFSVVPKVGVRTYWHLNANWIWANGVDYGYRYFLDISELRGSNYSAESRLYGLFKRIYFDMGGDYVFDQGRLNSEIDERRSSARSGFDINAIYQPVPRGYLTFSGRMESVEYDDQGFGSAQNLTSLDRSGSLFRMEYLYKLRARFWPFAGLLQRSFDFDTVGNPRDDSSFTGGYVGFRNETGGRLHYSVRAGLQEVTFDKAPQADDRVLTSETIVEYQASKHAFLRSTLRQAPIFSTFANQVFFLSTRWDLDVGMIPGERWRLVPGITLGRNDYEKQLAPVDPPRKDDIRALRIRVEIPTRKDLQWDFEVGYLERDSNYAGLGFEGLIFFTNISFQNSR